MRYSLRILSTLFALAVTALAALLPIAGSASALADDHPLISLQDFENLMDEVLAHRQRIQRYQPYDEYCLEDEFFPNKKNDRALLDKLEAINGQLKRKFGYLVEQANRNFLKPTGPAAAAAYPRVDGMGPLDSGWANPNNYWNGTVWAQRIQNLSTLLAAKRAEMEAKPENTCRKPPPPKPQPVDWMRGLRRPSPELISFIAPPPRFCSADEKNAWIAANITPELQQAADNALEAANYVVDVGRVKLQLEGLELAGTIDDDGKKGLRDIRAEYKWAEENRAKHYAADTAIKAHDAKARAIPIVDCSGPSQPVPDGGPIPRVDYEPANPMKAPERFCSEAEKQKFLEEVRKNHAAARRNYEKADALAKELQKRIAAGDRAAGLAGAQREASEAATRYFALWIKLDDVYYQALAMPVENCGSVTQGARAGAEAGAPSGVVAGAEAGAAVGAPSGVTAGSRAGAEAGTAVPPPPPPPATGAGKAKEVGIRYGAGYIEANTPQQFIGRIVVGGEDNAMIYTSPTLAGFYAEAEADFWDTAQKYAGEFGGFRIAASVGYADGDEYRRVEADPTITTGFLWINPLESGLPFAVGLGGTNLAWDARTSTENIDAAAMALYMQYRSLGPNLTGGVGAGVMADYRSTEHRTRIELLDGSGFTVDENYDFETFGLGPRIEGELRWDCDPESDGPFPSFGANLRAFVGGTYDWRNSDVWQRATGPFFGGFDVRQRVAFDDDGFNLRYGINATFEAKFDARTTAFVKLGWQGQSDAPTIVPADGSVPPGVPIRADTESADEWFIGGGLRIGF